MGSSLKVVTTWQSPGEGSTASFTENHYSLEKPHTVSHATLTTSLHIETVIPILQIEVALSQEGEGGQPFPEAAE